MERLKATQASIKKAIEIINSGGVIIFPTETVYGIGCSIKSKDGIKRIYKIKGRDKKKPLQVLISDIKQLDGLVSRISTQAHTLIDKYWPGPLTIIFKNKSGNGTIGVRMPDHKVALKLIGACGPLYATSANTSGDSPPVCAKDVTVEADLLLDGGDCTIKESSTVIDASTDHLKVIRKGRITLPCGLKNVLPNIEIY